MMNGSLTTVLQEDIPSFDIDRNKIFKCKYYDKGCRYKGTANDMINVHPHECNFEIIPCPNQGCDVKIERGQLGEHLKKCDYRDVHCIFCKQFYIFKEEKRHMEVCGEVFEKCPIVGCEEKVKRKDLKEHQADTCKHINLLNEKLEKESSHLRSEIMKCINDMKKKFEAKIEEIVNREKELREQIEKDKNEIQEKLLKEIEDAKKREEELKKQIENNKNEIKKLQKDNYRYWYYLMVFPSSPHNCYSFGEFAKPVEWLEREAKNGNSHALLNLGLCYFWGFKKEINTKEGENLIRKAAELQNICAKGLCAYWGFGRAQNVDESIKYFEKARSDGDVWGIHYTGVSYLFGHGVPKDKKKAIEQLMRASRYGCPLAYNFIGCFFANDVKNEEKAFEWFLRGAHEDFSMSLYIVGSRYETGKGINKDLHKARLYYERAARLNHLDAIERLRNWK